MFRDRHLSAQEPAGAVSLLYQALCRGTLRPAVPAERCMLWHGCAPWHCPRRLSDDRLPAGRFVLQAKASAMAVRYAVASNRGRYIRWLLLALAGTLAVLFLGALLAPRQVRTNVLACCWCCNACTLQRLARLVMHAWLAALMHCCLLPSACMRFPAAARRWPRHARFEWQLI